MKKFVGLALIMAVLLTSFCFTATAATPEKKFVIDGNLDVWYLSDSETPSSDLNYYHFVSLEAYNKDPDNGHGVSPYADPETAAEVYMAYDDDFVYLYVKCWDEDIARHESDVNNVSERSDSIEVWFDPDPNSQTLKPDGSPQNTNDKGEYPSFPECCGDPEQGDVNFRVRATDFEVGDTHNVVKPNYNGLTDTQWFNDQENLRGFYFENEEKVTDSGVVLTSGYGIETRIPRYDVTGGKNFRVNVACNNRCEDVSTWYALAMGESWWLDYSKANQVYYEAVNPFFAQDVSGKTMQYTENGYNAAGMLVKESIDNLPSTITILEKAQVQAIVDQYNALDSVQKGYVKARNFETLLAAATTLGIEIEDDVPPAVDVTLGDVNDDGAINAKDALEVLKATVGKTQLSDLQKVAADVNKDEAINAKDALEILKYTVNKPSALDK